MSKTYALASSSLCLKCPPYLASDKLLLIPQDPIKLCFGIPYSKWSFVRPSCPTFPCADVPGVLCTNLWCGFYLHCIIVRYLRVFSSKLSCEPLQGRGCVLFACISRGLKDLSVQAKSTEGGREGGRAICSQNIWLYTIT